MYRIIKPAAAAAAVVWSAGSGERAAVSADGCRRGRGRQAGVRSLVKAFQSLQPPSRILFLKYKIILPLISLVVRAQHRPIRQRGDLVQQVLVGQSFIAG